jgi:sodium-coupled neutral amino acid transporter 11
MTQGDVLNNFEHDSMQANAARLLLAFTMFLTYPMESFVARHVLVMLMHNGDMDAHPPDHGGEDVRGAGGGFSVENEERIEREEFGEGTERAIVEGGGILCMNRRQTWTFAIYLVSLLSLVSPLI